MSKRSFVKKNGKLQIKEEIELEDVYRKVSNESEIYHIHVADMMALVHKTCAFLRKYIPGEFAGFPLPKDFDLNEITCVYVIAYHSESHMLSHLEPLGDTYKVIIHDVDMGTVTNVRIPLLPEQVTIIEKEMDCHGNY